MNENLTNLLISFEELLNAQISFHDYSGAISKYCLKRFQFHAHPICSYVKKTHFKTCFSFESTFVQQKLIYKPDGCWKMCHAGVLEIYVPIFFHGKFSAAMFIGSFRQEKNNLFESVLVKKNTPKLKVDLDKLPVIKDDDMNKYLDMAKILKCYILDFLAKKESIPTSRKSQIKNFIERRFADSLYLKDIATYLDLTESRTGRVVKEIFGVTFHELLRDIRLRESRKLLINTEVSVNQVAELSGFNDSGYFHRIFKKAFAMTPLNYRQNYMEKTENI